MADETPEPNPRHAKVRRAKKFLRFMPRRAAFHRYPVVGRFAAGARRRAYLWSFKTVHVRPALYAGSVLSLLPVMGVQLPLAFALSLLLRANFMVLGGLQFITNPFTAAPIYYATHQLGQTVINATGFGRSLDERDLTLSAPPAPAEPAEPPRLEPARPAPPPPAPHGIHWTKRIGTAINALVIGGTLTGLALGLVLDIAWRIATRGSAGKIPRRPASRSTPPTAPPQ